MVSIGQLPTELLKVIFARIPPVSVMGLRGVCKEWRAAISMGREMLREAVFQISQENADAKSLSLYRERCDAIAVEVHRLEEHIVNADGVDDETWQMIKALRQELKRLVDDYRQRLEQSLMRVRYGERLMRKIYELGEL